MGYKMTTKNGNTGNSKQLKPRLRKNLIAQEIAFAKILAGNDAKQRHRAVKKLKLWLKARTNGKNDFTEDEFTRIWTGLFYCMWMSDKFLIQEELAESLSQLVHCFEENHTTALSFIKTFNKTLVLEWPGLDQHRLDKFGMLVRRFLRQSLDYCRRKEWDPSTFQKLMNIYRSSVLGKNVCVGYMLHFIEIYLEEFAKVSKGEVDNEIVKIAMEPFVKLLCTTKDVRIVNALKIFFEFLMTQTDIGIEFEEKFRAWKEQKFPGPSPDALQKIEVNDDDDNLSNENDEWEDEEEDLTGKELDPRAGKVDVELPQIPVDPDCMISLLRRYLDFRDATVKGKKKLKLFMHKFESLKKGQFPYNIKKDPILDKIPKKGKRKNMIQKSALELLKFEQNIDKIIETKGKNLEEVDEYEPIEIDDIDVNMDVDEETEKPEEKTTPKRKIKKLKRKKISVEPELNGKPETVTNPKSPKKNLLVNGKTSPVTSPKSPKKNAISPKKNLTIEEVSDDVPELSLNGKQKKRKVLNDWQVDEIDANSPDYNSIKLPKIIKLEKKVVEREVNGTVIEQEIEINVSEDKSNEMKTPVKHREFKENHELSDKESEKTANGDLHVFWSTAKSKLKKNKSPRSSLVPNPLFAEPEEEKSQGSRRISFALHRNMAQECEEYLEEVRNSPKIPFDGNKKPIQSALKVGLSPSPINPFYRLKRNDTN